VPPSSLDAEREAEDEVVEEDVVVEQEDVDKAVADVADAEAEDAEKRMMPDVEDRRPKDKAMQFLLCLRLLSFLPQPKTILLLK
jgi:hypothetical protein